MAQGTKKKSRNWSLKEIKEIAKIIEDTVATGKTKLDGYDAAATHFGVTRNAIGIRYGRYLKGIKLPKVKKNTTKKPTKGEGVPRKPYKKRTLKPEIKGRSMTLKIKDVLVDLKNGEIKIIY
jgi:hypothetical protein